MAFWWVNHKQTRDHEVRGGYVWSPMRNANGAINQTYENMTRVRPGDIVFSYAHGRLGAVGRVTWTELPTVIGIIADASSPAFGSTAVLSAAVRPPSAASSASDIATADGKRSAGAFFSARATMSSSAP